VNFSVSKRELVDFERNTGVLLHGGMPQSILVLLVPIERPFMNVRHFAVIASLLFALGLPNRLHAAQQPPLQAGIVTQALNATDGNTSITEGATVYSGDLLKTTDHGRLQIQVGTIQFVLNENSSARIFHAGTRTLVEVERGILAYSVRGVNEDLVLYAQDIKIVPRTNVAAAGQIDITTRCSVTVTSTHNKIDVTSGRESRTIEESKTFRVVSEVGVDYKDDWQPVLTDYPEYPRDADYHHSHSHVACPAAYAPQSAQHAPIAGGTGHFTELAGGVVGIITGILVHQALESPDRP
jgi:hypothetical protein